MVALLADECERFVAACFVVACAVAIGEFPLKRERCVVAFITDAVAIAINLAIIINVWAIVEFARSRIAVVRYSERRRGGICFAI